MSARKKKRVGRPRLTHFEVRRGAHLRLRVAIADDAIAEVGDELGALFRKIAPSVAAQDVPREVVSPSAQVVVAAHHHTNDDEAYHAGLRDHFTEFFSTLCDASLADALEIAREERARRAEGQN
jgi:xanthine/CO dehydrogenase XdhC/CoxF family maturation factor